jgi:hypothetical protein
MKAKKPTKATKAKAKPAKKAAKPMQVKVLAGKPTITTPQSGQTFDMASLDPNPAVIVSCSLPLSTYSQACAQVFAVGDEVNSPSDDPNYTNLPQQGSTSTFGNPGPTDPTLVPVDSDVEIPSSVPTNNNAKVLVWGLNIEDGDDDSAWDPIGFVYIKLWDSSE